MTIQEFVTWINRIRPAPNECYVKLADDERTITVRKQKWMDTAVTSRLLSSKVDAFIRRGMRKFTAKSVPGRTNLFAVDSLVNNRQPVLPPSAMDPSAMYDADPRHLSGSFWEFMDALSPVGSNINILSWIHGHRLHCEKCKDVSAEWLPRASRSDVSLRCKEAFAVGCYGARCVAYLLKGYSPLLTEDIPKFKHTNYKSMFSCRGVKQAWIKQLKVPGVFGKGNASYINPLTGSEKYLDVMRSREDPECIPKCRICFDGSVEINPRLAKWPFRYEDFVATSTHLKPNEHYASVDIEGFFLRLPMSTWFTKCLSFRDPLNGDIKCYLTSPFGLSTSPAYASAVSAEAREIILARCSSRGLYPAVHTHVDDFLIRDTHKHKVINETIEAERTLADLRLPSASAKTIQATQNIQHLGRGIDSKLRLITIKAQHKQHAQNLMAKLLDQGLNGRDMHHLCGLLNYIEPAVFASRPRIRPFWLHLKLLKKAKRKRDVLSKSLLIDATWWLGIFLRGLPKLAAPWLNPNTMDTAYAMTDASGDVGGGAWINTELHSTVWNGILQEKSVVFKELHTAVQATHLKREKLREKCLYLFSDSMSNVCAFLAGSSRSEECHQLLRTLSSLQRQHLIQITFSWLPREHNAIADLLSKNKIPNAKPLRPPCVLQDRLSHIR